MRLLIFMFLSLCRNMMHARKKPLLYMTYINLPDATNDWADGLKTDLMSNPGKFQVAQIGLSMTSCGTPSAHYKQDVAAGLYDKQIEMFAMGAEIASLVNEKKPVGDYSVEWNASVLESGIYFCRLQSGIFSVTKKLFLQK